MSKKLMQEGLRALSEQYRLPSHKSYNRPTMQIGPDKAPGGGGGPVVGGGSSNYSINRDKLLTNIRLKDVQNLKAFDKARTPMFDPSIAAVKGFTALAKRPKIIPFVAAAPLIGKTSEELLSPIIDPKNTEWYRSNRPYSQLFFTQPEPEPEIRRPTRGNRSGR